MVGRVADEVVLSDEERTFLEAQVRRHKAARSLSDRCRMILLCTEGLQSKEVAERLGVHEHTVGKWRRRFVKDRIEGLTDEYRPGRPRTVQDAQVAEVIERTLNTTPKDATHWSIRSMAAETGLSHTTIRRIWTAFGLQPHRSETFKLSTDPLFVDGAVIGKCYKRHRATEFLDFLKRIDAAVPKGPDVHLVMDNYATHKTPKIKAWLARRPHWHIHFTPTSASWINQVERWFAELTRKQLQRGVHRSTAELEADITAFIAAHNEDPKPYKWIKSADEILAAVKRFCQRTDRTLCSEL